MQTSNLKVIFQLACEKTTATYQRRDTKLEKALFNLLHIFFLNLNFLKPCVTLTVVETGDYLTFWVRSENLHLSPEDLYDQSVLYIFHI